MPPTPGTAVSGPPASSRSWRLPEPFTVLDVWIMAVCGAGSALLVAAALLLGGIGAASILVALPPFVLVVGAFLFLDRYEPEPRSALVWATLWGSTVCIAGAMLLESIVSSVIGAPLDGVSFIQLSVSAPLVEEALKGLGLVLLWRRGRVSGVLNAVIYGGLIAAGFALVENVGYFMMAAVEEDIAGLVFTFVLRGVMSPFAHPLFTLFTAVGVGLAATRRRQAYAYAGFPFAVVTHGLWNHMASNVESAGQAAAAYGLVMVPLFFCASGAVLMVFREEVRVLRRCAPLVADILLPEELELLWRIRARRTHQERHAHTPAARRAHAVWISEVARVALARERELRIQGVLSSAGQDGQRLAAKRAVWEHPTS